MPPWIAAVGISIAWALGSVLFGLLPVWISLSLSMVNREIPFSEVDLLKGGGIIIFAVTLTGAVLIDYFVSRFRFQSRFAALLFNLLVPMTIILAGIIIHISTSVTKTDALQTAFVLQANVWITVLAIAFCVVQKTLLVLNDRGKP